MDIALHFILQRHCPETAEAVNLLIITYCRYVIDAQVRAKTHHCVLNCMSPNKNLAVFKLVKRNNSV